MYASQKTRKLGIFSSLVAIVVCVILITGSTFSLFTGNTNADISISAGQIELTAKLDNLALKSLGVLMPGTTFANGGTAKLDGNKLDLYNITPGDRVELDLVVTNESTVKIGYRVIWKLNGTLAEHLEFSIDTNEFAPGTDTSSWSLWEPANPDTKTHTLAIELPQDVGIEAMNLTATIEFDLEAVQHNVAEYPAVGTVTVPDNNTEDVVLSTESVEVTIPASAAEAGDDYKIEVSNETTETDEATGETTIGFDLKMYKNDVKVSGDTVYAITKNIGSGLFISEVTHNGVAMTKAGTGADQTYSYDSATGVLTIYTKSFSPFAVTYTTYKDFVRKLNIAHTTSSYISISTGSSFLPIVAVMPEITGYSVFDGDTRITNSVTFRFNDVKKETIDEASYKVSVDMAILDSDGNDLVLKPGMPSTINGKEYLHLFLNLIELPEGYSVSEVKVNGESFTLTQNQGGNCDEGEYWIGYDGKDVYLQSAEAGLIEVIVTKAAN